MEKETFLNGEAFQHSKTTFWSFGARLGSGDLEIMYKTEDKCPFEVQVLDSVDILLNVLKMDDFMREDWSL